MCKKEECRHLIGEVSEYMNSCCPLCEAEKAKRFNQCLEVENKRLKAKLARYYIRANIAEDKNKQLREALQKIQSWASAYPLKVFPKPNLKKAHKALKAVGMTLDAISADNMRHVITRVTDIVEQALMGE